MTEMLMTTAETTNDGSASQTPADGVTQQAQANGATQEAGNQQQAVDGQNQQAQGEANAGENKGDQGETPTTLGAPESYEFAPPEGTNLDAGVMDAFTEIAKELDLSQTAAEKVLNKMAPVLAERSQAQIKQAQQQWIESSIKDKEFGGDKLEENLSVAMKAMDAFATPELRQLLNESGLGNHPEIIRMMYRAGKAISEDRYVGPSQGSGSAKGQATDFNGKAAALYSNQQT
jgi:hypothetical protein